MTMATHGKRCNHEHCDEHEDDRQRPGTHIHLHEANTLQTRR
jgi:hypothetical protein